MDKNDARARAGVEAVLERYHKLASERAGQLFDYDCMIRVELLHVRARDSSVVFKFTPSQQYANLNGALHGGAWGILFDMFTMAACGTIARRNYWEFMGGVSRSLNLSYLRSVPIGTPLYFRSRVVQHGKTMALIHGEATDESGSVVYATCDHHKVNVPIQKAHKELRLPFDDLLDRESEQAKQGAKL